MWKLVILTVPLQRKFWLCGGSMETFWCTGIAPKQKQRQRGWVCCTNLVIVRQIYDLQLHHAVIAFLLHIIYWHPLPI